MGRGSQDIRGLLCKWLILQCGKLRLREEEKSPHLLVLPIPQTDKRDLAKEIRVSKSSRQAGTRTNSTLTQNRKCSSLVMGNPSSGFRISCALFFPPRTHSSQTCLPGDGVHAQVPESPLALHHKLRAWVKAACCRGPSHPCSSIARSGLSGPHRLSLRDRDPISSKVRDGHAGFEGKVPSAHLHLCLTQMLCVPHAHQRL